MIGDSNATQPTCTDPPPAPLAIGHAIEIASPTLAHAHPRERAYRLASWMVRALIPESRIGSYVLIDRDEPVYVGRSDTCLRRRLLQHAHRRRAEYFAYNVHHTRIQAYTMECALYHALAPQIRNLIHPDSPDQAAARCSYCRPEWALPHLAPSFEHNTQRFVPSQRKPR